jgi:hypothetical protein
MKRIAQYSKWVLSLLVGVSADSLPELAQAQPDDTCDVGFVWREAFPGDHVCVTPKTRTQAAADNALNDSRTVPGGCKSGFVFREARPNDPVCVPPETRGITRSDNRQAWNRQARNRDNPATSEKVFVRPFWGEERLDWCLHWGKSCGQPAADHFCKRRRFTSAIEFDREWPVGPTRTIGSEQTCSLGTCSGFRYITCHGDIPDDQIFVNPSWNGKRLDTCLTYHDKCGQPVADEFCRRNGFKSSFFFVPDPWFESNPTHLLGNDQSCTFYCKGFQMIICQ